MYKHLVLALRRMIVCAGESRCAGHGTMPYMVKRILSDVLRPFGMYAEYHKDTRPTIAVEGWENAAIEPKMVWLEIEA